MANKTKKILIPLCLFSYGIVLQAQQTISAAGGNATGTSGTVNYTVGQVAYITNTDSSGTITQGVQQPYEIFPNGIREAEGISLECSVFPNPTSEFLKLKIENYKFENLSYHFYNMNGKLYAINLFSESYR